MRERARGRHGSAFVAGPPASATGCFARTPARRGALTAPPSWSPAAPALLWQVAPRPSAKLRGGAAVNDLGPPALHEACGRGHTALVSLLLDASAPLTLLSPGGLPPLHVAAAAAAGAPVIELLVRREAPLRMRDDRRQTALHAAARAGHVAAIRALLRAAAAEAETATRAAKEAYVELRDRWHRTALHWAVVNMEPAAVEALIQGGAAVNGVPMPVGKHMKQTSLPLEAPLHSAARLPPPRAAPLLRLLLQAQADVARTDQFGQTALHCAAAASSSISSSASGGDPGEGEAGSTAVVALLLRAGADPCHADSNGKSATDLASHTLVARALRDAEAGVRG